MKHRAPEKSEADDALHFMIGDPSKSKKTGYNPE
jgi:hypothetical protein